MTRENRIMHLNYTKKKGKNMRHIKPFYWHENMRQPRKYLRKSVPTHI